MTIKPKLIMISLILTILPITVVGILGFSVAKKALQKTTIDTLTVVAEFRESQMFHYIEQSKHITKDFSSDGFIRKSMYALQLGNSKSKAVHKDLVHHLKKNKLTLHEELVMIDLLGINGKVLASTMPERTGLDQSNTKFFKRSLHETIVKAVNEPMLHDRSFEVSMPLYAMNNNKYPLGVMVCHFSQKVLNKLLTSELTLNLGARTQFERIGKTGETYLVNSDYLMVTDSLFVKDAAYRQKVNTYPVKAGLLQNKEVSGLWLDYRGIPVVGATMVLEIGDIKWILVSEQDEEEALEPIAYLKKSFSVIMFLSLIISLMVGISLSLSIARPVLRLKASVDQIIRGNLNSQVNQIDRNDEIGFLSKAFNIMVVKLQDALTQLEDSNRELKEMATHDGLTSLFNHRYLNEALQHEMDRAERYKGKLSCIMMDIDFFKKVNDNNGHLFGDFVLHEIAKLILKSSRITDIAGRYGGEEFLLILPDTELDAASIVAEKLRAEVQGYEFVKEGVTCGITISMGVSEYSDLIKNTEQLLQQADEALYYAKKCGRNRVEVYQPEMLC